MKQTRTIDGWQWVALGDICDVITGNTPARAETKYYGGDIPWIKPDNLDVSMYVKDSDEYLSKEGGKVARLLPRGSVLVSCIGNIGKTAIADRELATNQQINSLIPKANVDSEFLYYACWFIKPELLARASKALLPILNKTQFSSIQIPLPPLDEQRRIASRLNEQLAAVESVRKAAEEQLEAARQLPSAYLREVFDNQIANKWSRVRLGDILYLRKEIIHPYDKPKGPAVFVGLEHIESNTGVRIGSVDVEMSQLTGRKPKFYKGDIVYGYLRPYLNKVWIAEFDGLCSVDQYTYKVDDKRADKNFVAWFMRSPVYLERAPIHTTPGQLPRIRTEEVASVEINLPPLDEQKRISLQILEKLDASKNMIDSIGAQLAEINRLPASLLREAFAGQG